MKFFETLWYPQNSVKTWLLFTIKECETRSAGNYLFAWSKCVRDYALGHAAHRFYVTKFLHIQIDMHMESAGNIHWEKNSCLQFPWATYSKCLNKLPKGRKFENHLYKYCKILVIYQMCIRDRYSCVYICKK